MCYNNIIDSKAGLDKRGDFIINRIITTILILALAAVIATMAGYYSWSCEKQREAASRYGVVTGVLLTDGEPCAVIDTEVVHEGAILHGIKVVKIHKDKVEFEKNSKRWTQNLRERPSYTWPEIEEDIR